MDKKAQKNLEKKLNHFLGTLEIPVYNKLKNYNYHDTLDQLLKRLFGEIHELKFK